MVGPGRNAKRTDAFRQVNQAWEGAGVRGVAAELAVVVGAPTIHVAFGGHRARVALTGVKVDNGGTKGQIHAPTNALTDPVRAGGGGVAALLLVVLAPAHHGWIVNGGR